MPEMNDVRSEIVEVCIRSDGQAVWINTPAGCITRVCGIKELIVVDERGDIRKVAKRMYSDPKGKRYPREPGSTP